MEKNMEFPSHKKPVAASRSDKKSEEKKQDVIECSQQDIQQFSEESVDDTQKRTYSLTKSELIALNKKRENERKEVVIKIKDDDLLKKLEIKLYQEQKSFIIYKYKIIENEKKEHSDYFFPYKFGTYNHTKLKDIIPTDMPCFCVLNFKCQKFYKPVLIHYSPDSAPTAEKFSYAFYKEMFIKQFPKFDVQLQVDEITNTLEEDIEKKFNK